MKTPKGTPNVEGKNRPTPKNARTPKQGQSPLGLQGIQKTPASAKNTPKKTPAPAKNTPKKTPAPAKNTPKKTPAPAKYTPKKTPASAKNTPDNAFKHVLQKIGKESLDGLKKGSLTPQPMKGQRTPVAGNKVKTPKSAPPGDSKRKRLTEEISDEEFEHGLNQMEVKKKQNGMADKDEIEAYGCEIDYDSDDLDDLGMDDSEEDDDYEEGDSDESDKGVGSPALKRQKLEMKKAAKVTKKAVKEAKRAKGSKKAQDDPKKLFITGFNKKKTRAKVLKDLFPDSLNVHVPMDRVNCRGYAFVFFASEEKAKASHDKHQGTKLHGRTLSVTFAKRTDHLVHRPKRNPKRQEKEEPANKKRKSVPQKNGED